MRRRACRPSVARVRQSTRGPRTSAVRPGALGYRYGNSLTLDLRKQVRESAHRGAQGRTRTGTALRPADFKSAASTNSATRAVWYSEARIRRWWAQCNSRSLEAATRGAQMRHEMSRPHRKRIGARPERHSFRIRSISRSARRRTAREIPSSSAIFSNSPRASSRRPEACAT